MQLVWRGCALLMVVLVACGGDDGGPKVAPDAPPPDPNEGLRSGTRIHLQWHEYGDTRVFAGLFDGQRNESCSATLWADGKTYCTPVASNIVYTDKDCSMPIGQVSHLIGCTGVVPTYLVAKAVSGCSAQPSHLYQAGAKIASTPYYQLDSITGMCLGPNTSSANFDYYAVGAEVAATDLAALTRTPSGDTGRIQRQFLATSDGAKIFDTPHDTMLDLDCTPMTTPGATSVACAPNTTLANYFHDEMCKIGEVVSRAECPKPAYVSQAIQPVCPNSPINYFTVGDATTAPPIYTAADCSSTAEPADSAFYLLGQPLVVAMLTRTRDTLPDRAVQLIHDSDGTNPIRDGLLYDSQHMTDCEEVPQLDGSTRCLPKSGNVASYFSDMNCMISVKVAQIFVGPASCAAPAVPTLITRALPPMPPTACGATFEIYEVGAAYTGKLYSGTPQACAEADTSGFQNYTLGTEHAPSEFAEGTVVRDP